jgi:hypothetical protein
MSNEKYDLTNTDAANMPNDELANWIENILNEDGFDGYKVGQLDRLALIEVVDRLRSPSRHAAEWRTEADYQNKKFRSTDMG